MSKFVEAIVRTTTIERAFITYDDDGVITEYETRDLHNRESLEIVEVLDEDDITN